jgi:hypothetical protein
VRMKVLAAGRVVRKEQRNFASPWSRQQRADFQKVRLSPLW